MSSPPKIMAEWIVRAQLTIRKSNGNQSQPNDELESPIATTVERLGNTDNSMKVTYKWCTQEPMRQHPLQTPSHTSSNSSHKDGMLSSTGVISSDSGISSTDAMKSNILTATPIDANNSKFESSCNIILTACTNIIPEHNEYAEDLATTFYTLFPDAETTVKSNVPVGSTIGVRDAFCQTSDNETLAAKHTMNTLETGHLYGVNDLKQLHRVSVPFNIRRSCISNLGFTTKCIAMWKQSNSTHPSVRRIIRHKEINWQKTSAHRPH